MRIHKALSVLAVVGFVAFGADASSGCATQKNNCEEQCSCAGTPENKPCIDMCNDQNADEDVSSAAAGCSSQYGVMTACIAEHAICDPEKKELVVPVKDCGSAIQALLDCEFPVMHGSTIASSATSTGSM